MVRRVCGIAIAITSLLATVSASAQQYPSRPVRLVVPYAAGGTGDIVARVVADRLGAALGQSVVVENRPGATGAIGSQDGRVGGARRAHDPGRPDRRDGDQPALEQGFGL